MNQNSEKVIHELGYVEMHRLNLVIVDGHVYRDRQGEPGRKATEAEIREAELVIEKGVVLKKRMNSRGS